MTPGAAPRPGSGRSRGRRGLLRRHGRGLLPAGEPGVRTHLRLRANALNLAAVRVIVPAEAVDTYDVPEDAPPTSGIKIHPGDFFHQVFLYHLALNGVDVVRALR